MENVSFEKLWQLLAPEGEYCRRRKACERLWLSFSPERQRAVYGVLVAKTVNGDYLSPNPYYAIDDNDKPTFLRGDETGDLVQVRHNGSFKICTRQTMYDYNLQYVAEWKSQTL